MDLSFATLGRYIEAGYNSNRGSTIVQNPINNELIVGSIDQYSGWQNQIFERRLSSMGILDTSYGSSGVAMFDLAGLYEGIYRMAVDSLGRSYYTARGDARFSTNRINSNGTLDTANFGNDVTTSDTDGDGQVIDELIDVENGFALAVDNGSGSVFVGGATGRYNQPNKYDFAVIKYLSDGNKDTTFGNDVAMGASDGDGIIILDINSEYQGLFDLDLISGGKILGAGGVSNDVAVFQLNADGTPDTAFGSAGIQRFSVIDSAERDTAQDMHVSSSDGSLFVTGVKNHDGQVENGARPEDKCSRPTCDIFVAKLTAAGAIDTTFGDNGRFVIDLSSGREGATRVIELSSGKIVVTGTTRDVYRGKEGFVLLLNADGTLDITFGEGGILRMRLSPDDKEVTFADAIVMHDGHLAIVGSRSDGSIREMLVTKILLP